MCQEDNNADHGLKYITCSMKVLESVKILVHYAKLTRLLKEGKVSAGLSLLSHTHNGLSFPERHHVLHNIFTKAVTPDDAKDDLVSEVDDIAKSSWIFRQCSQRVYYCFVVASQEAQAMHMMKGG